MSKIDDLIANNRDQFDFKEPAKGHDKRFMNKLSKSEHFNYRYLIRLAAILISGMLIFTSVYYYRQKIEYSPDRFLSELNPELRKAVYYYENCNSRMIETIENMEFTSPETKTEIFEDIRNYDKDYKDIMDDLKNYPDNDRVINAFIEHYRSKTELLGFIVAQLNETHQIKENN